MAAEYLLKWSPEQTRRLIMFRVENEERFTKRKSKHLWGTLIRDLGLEGKMTPQQFAKKWNNLKMKYKLLKDPPAGMGLWSKESYWRWFDLMDQAMSGLAQGSVLSPAPSVAGHGSVLSSVSLVQGEELARTPVHPVKGEWPQWPVTESQRGVKGGLIPQNWPTPPPLGPAVSGGTAGQAQHISVATMKQEQSPRADLGRERQRLEGGQGQLDRDKLVLDREREQLSRERGSVERERVALEKEKAGVDRERAVLDRERAVLDRERAVLCRERTALDQERSRLTQEKERHLLDGLARGPRLAAELQHQARLLCLWERLVDAL